MIATIHNLAADICDRIPGMQLDNRLNNAAVIEQLLKPLYDKLATDRIKLAVLISQKMELERELHELRCSCNACANASNAPVSRQDFR